jgi:hypothetical protein
VRPYSIPQAKPHGVFCVIPKANTLTNTLGVVPNLLLAACLPALAACCLLRAACCVHAACCWPRAACNVQHATRSLLAACALLAAVTVTLQIPWQIPLAIALLPPEACSMQSGFAACMQRATQCWPRDACCLCLLPAACLQHAQRRAATSMQATCNANAHHACHVLRAACRVLLA